MSRDRVPFNAGRVNVGLVAAFVALSLMMSQIVKAAERSGHEVWLVYFGSSDCPVCEHIDPILNSLIDEYDVKIRRYDITRPDDYLIFSQIESLHSDGKFSVPLLIIGENLLIGEKQILANLKKLVEKYRAGSGAPLPYLGDGKSPKSGDHAEKTGCAECADKGRPPSIQGELKKLKLIIDKFLE